MISHLKTLLRTDFTTIIALYALESINTPGRFNFLNFNCSGWTSSFTQSTEDTISNRNTYFTSCIRVIIFLLYGIKYCIWSMKQIFKKCLGHTKKRHIYLNSAASGDTSDLNHRSVQLIQGSMVRIKMGTSASAHPFSVSSKAGTFAKVGVRTLILSKNFVPFAFA